MAKPPKTVIDTNVFLSAIFFGGLPQAIVKMGEAKLIKVVTSNLLLLELEEKLIRKFGSPRKDTEEILEKIRSFAEVIKITGKAKFAVADPKDHMVIETALSSGSSFIVTGDYHLLRIKNIKGLKILKPREFVEEKTILDLLKK